MFVRDVARFGIRIQTISKISNAFETGFEIAAGDFDTLSIDVDSDFDNGFERSVAVVQSIC